MFSKNIFSERLLALRKKNNISQTAIANELGITYFQISKMENAIRGPSIEVAYALADYFGVSLDYLVGRTDNPEINK